VYASASEPSDAARTSQTQAVGAQSPSGDSRAPIATGSGLKAGPPSVLRSPPASSRPQISQLHAS